MISKFIENEERRIADSIMNEIDMNIARAWWEGMSEYENMYSLDVYGEYYLRLVIDIDSNTWNATIVKENNENGYNGYKTVIEKIFEDDDPCYLMEEMAQWAAEERMKFNN